MEFTEERLVFFQTLWQRWLHFQWWEGATSDVTAAKICCEQFTQEALVLPQFEEILGAKARASKRFSSAARPPCVRGNGARGCVSVPGPDKGRVHECVSIRVGLLVSYPAALVHQQGCHVAEQIPALMDECNLLPTQLLARQKVLRKIPLHGHFYSLKKHNKYCLFLLWRTHTHRVGVFLKTESRCLALEFRIIIDDVGTNPDQLPNIRLRLKVTTWLVMPASLLLPLASLGMLLYECSVLSLCNQRSPSASPSSSHS